MQALSPDIGAIVYKKQNLVVFFYRNIIFYKVLLTELNITKVTIEEHVERAKSTLKALKYNLIPMKDLSTIKNNMRGFDRKIGQRL